MLFQSCSKHCSHPGVVIYFPRVRKGREWLLNSDLLASGMVSLKDLNGEADLGAMGARLINVLEVLQWPLKMPECHWGK